MINDFGSMGLGAGIIAGLIALKKLVKSLHLNLRTNGININVDIEEGQNNQTKKEEEPNEV